MSEKPHAARKDGQEAVLEQIFTQGLEKLKTPAEESPPENAPSAPEQEGGGENTSFTSKKNRQSAVYLYLLVLFGAAFLMLLLAYFVQQRSSENAIDSMSLSREELLAEIRELEEKTTALEGQNIALAEQNAALQELYESQRREVSERIDSYDALVVEHYATLAERYSWEFFWELERFYQAGDYEACAALLILRDQGEYSYRTPDAALERDDEIILAVIDAGFLKADFHLHPEEYKDLVDALMSRYYLSGYVSRETER